MEEQVFVHKYIKSIEFGIFSPKIIKEMAAAKIVTPELYDKEGYPVDGGLMDLRLGVIDPGLKCKTDGQKLKDSLGHFGYIELARPVVHIKYVNLIATLLRGTCRACGKATISAQKKEAYLDQMDHAQTTHGIESRKDVIKDVIKVLKTATKCAHCKTKQLKISIEKPTNFQEGEKKLSPIEVRTRLEKISDDDLPLFGLNPAHVRPEWLIMTVLPIPPVTMRPSITLESGERSEDDLTHKLGDIVRINQRLFENINAGAPEIIIEDLWDLLQYHVTTFFDNDVAQLPPARHRSGQPLKTLTERIKSKEGRIRHNLAGKRTNFSARAVISPDPMIGVNEVGVPKIVAMKITVPERITEWNMAYLKKFVERGPKDYPGANYVVRPDGRKKRVTDDMKEQILEELQPGYSVERHMMDGDIAIFNRQPSLHRMSMMCHRVRVLPGRTFRINPAVADPYGADFDGDEMNLHVPQTEEARAEAEILMDVSTQLVSPRYGLNIIGCKQDAISGCYLLTKNIEAMPYDEAVQMLFSVGLTAEEIDIPMKDTVTGRDVISALLPNDFSFTSVDKAGDEFVIEHGKLLRGQMDGKNLGHGSGLLLRTMLQKYGHVRTVRIIEQLFKIGIKVLEVYGITTSVSDTDLPAVVEEEIEEILQTHYTKVEEIIEKFNKGELETFPGKTKKQTLELKILETLNKVANLIGNAVQQHTIAETGTLIMARSGARGSPMNLSRMAACVGQQALGGKRIEHGFKDRTLTCFKRGDLAPAAHGFVKRGFKQGLNPAEFFFVAMTGRESLIDVALRTPKSGYLYRRLANAMQDLKVEYDDTVRDSSGKIIQFRYGEDGIDVSRSEGGTVNIKRIVSEVLQ